MNELIPIQDIQTMAIAIAKSRLFGIQVPEQAIALMLVAQAEGRHPAIAARDYHIVNGRPTLKADAILARFQDAGGRVEWHTYTNDCCEATFSHPAGGNLRIAWTIEDAKRAGLLGRGGPWQQYPRAMLRARLISEAVRTLYPGVMSGSYTPEEAMDMPSGSGYRPTSAPAPVSVVLPPAFDEVAAAEEIAGFEDVNEMRAWLALERRRYGWRPGDAQYESLKAACAERAKVIKQAEATVAILEAATLETAPEAADE